MTRSGLSGWVGLIAVALVLAAEAWAARPASIRGAERVFLRRGPGTEFQAYGTVENLEQVTVDEVTGSWALVHTATGQSGYVHASFLFYADNKPVLVSTPTTGPARSPTSAAAAAAPQAVPPTASLPTAPAGLEANDQAQRNVELAAEPETSKREAETAHRAPAVPSPGEDLVALRAEVRRLADITDALRSRLDSPSSSGGASLPLAGGEESWGTSTVWVLAGCALVLGWLIGGVLARREERGRRNRIRF